MKYLSVAETAEKWNISDRRVRSLCSSGRIPGVIADGKRYLIPENAEKPRDGRYKHGLGTAGDGITKNGAEGKKLFLKWADDVIGTIDGNYTVRFNAPDYNETVALYTEGKSLWSRDEFESFLADRIISRERRDIEGILFRLGFSHYDVIKLALATRAVNAKDLLWIAFDENEKYKDTLTNVFSSIFMKKKDLEGGSVDSPEGYNIKRYGVYNGRCGIYKKRINPLTTDIESEVAVYELAKILGVGVCPAYKTDEDTVFSEFEYDFAKEFIVHFRRLFMEGGLRGENEYHNLIAARPQYQKEIVQMIALDFITRQDDRHLSNIAMKISGKTESFYPLYDNGRSLFYDETEETVKRAVKDLRKFSTGFGPSGSYYDYVTEIAESGIRFSELLNLEISKAQIKSVLKKSGISGYRLEGCVLWIANAIEYLKNFA